MKRLALLCVLVAAGCSAAEPMPETVAECDARIAAVRGQIDAAKTEAANAEVLLKKVGEDRAKLANEADSDAKADRLAEIETAEADLNDKKAATESELASLQEKLQELNDHRKALAESETEAKARTEEDARQKTDANAAARLKAEEEAKKKAEEEARLKADEESKKKTDMEAEARKKAEEEARARAAEEAKKKAEEEAKLKAAAEAEAKRKAEDEARAKADGDAQRKLDEESRKKVEAKAKADALVVQGTALFREVADGMKNPPQDPEKANALLKKDEDAIAALQTAKEIYGALPAAEDPGREDRFRKIDRLVALLKTYAGMLKK